MRRIIHVNQHAVRRNAKRDASEAMEPVITVKTHRANTYGFTVEFADGKVVYSPDKPLSCGAKVWIETNNPVVVDGVVI